MKNKNKRPNGQKENRIMSLLVNAALVVAAAVGGGLLGMGVRNVANAPANTTITAETTTQVTTTALPTINASKAIALATKKVKQLDLTNKQVITIYGPIGNESYSVSKEITKLGKTGKPIYILINSPGGSVLDGALIVSAIEASPVPVYTICEQLCASMAFIIHQYGHTRMMVDRALLMGHPASGGVQGTLEQMQSRLGTIQRYVNKFNARIAQRAGLTLEQILPLVVSEMWIDAEDSTAQKFNDEIVNVNMDVPAPSPGLFEEYKRRNEAKQRVDIKW